MSRESHEVRLWGISSLVPACFVIDGCWEGQCFILLHRVPFKMKLRNPLKFWFNFWICIEFLIWSYANRIKFTQINWKLFLFRILLNTLFTTFNFNPYNTNNEFVLFTQFCVCVCVVGSSSKGAKGVYQTEAGRSHHSTSGRQAVHWKPALGNKRRIMGNMCRLTLTCLRLCKSITVRPFMNSEMLMTWGVCLCVLAGRGWALC